MRVIVYAISYPQGGCICYKLVPKSIGNLYPIALCRLPVVHRFDLVEDDSECFLFGVERTLDLHFSISTRRGRIRGWRRGCSC